MKTLLLLLGLLCLASSGIINTTTSQKFMNPDMWTTSDLMLETKTTKKYSAYYQTWSEQWKSDPTKTGLASLPAYVNVVNIAFMQPDASYSGDSTLTGTGIDFPGAGSDVKTSIATLKQKNPDTQVVVAVGGATYWNWAGLNEKAIAQFVKDFGLDGVDIDYEPVNPVCTFSGGQGSCTSDAEFISVVKRIRAALPRPYVISLAGWSIGAYGVGDYQNAQPQGANTGLSVNMLKSDAGKDLDRINIMSYDASSALDPKQAFSAYSSLFSGEVLIGVEIPPEAWGGHTLSLAELAIDINFINQKNGAGIMLWSLQKSGSPSGQAISDAVCVGFGLSGCGSKLFPNGY